MVDFKHQIISNYICVKCHINSNIILCQMSYFTKCHARSNVAHRPNIKPVNEKNLIILKAKGNICGQSGSCPHQIFQKVREIQSVLFTKMFRSNFRSWIQFKRGKASVHWNCFLIHVIFQVALQTRLLLELIFLRFYVLSLCIVMSFTNYFIVLHV